MIRKLFVALALLAGVVPMASTPSSVVAAPGDQPDGKIAYVVEVQTGGQIWVAGDDGSDPRQLTSGYDDANPSWNPQGTLLAFTRHFAWPYTESNGVFQAVMLLDPSDGSVWSPYPLSELDELVWVEEMLLGWAPDGGGVYFERSWSPTIWTSERVYLSTAGTVPGSKPLVLPSLSNIPGCAATPELTHIGDASPMTFDHAPGSTKVYYQSSCGVMRGEVGDPGPATLLASITSPQGTPTIFVVGDISPDGTQLTNGLQAIAASGGAERNLFPTVFSMGFLPELNCTVFISSGHPSMAGTLGDASWAPADDMIASSGHYTGECGGQAVDGSGIWRIDPLGQTPPRLLLGGGAKDADIQCRAGSCLTMLQIVTQATNLPAAGQTPNFSYSGAVSGVVQPIDPFGNGGVLAARVIGGRDNTVTASPASGYRLGSVVCDQPATVSLATRQVIIAVAGDTTATCTFNWEGGVDPTDPCDLDPDSCEPPPCDEPCPPPDIPDCDSDTVTARGFTSAHYDADLDVPVARDPDVFDWDVSATWCVRDGIVDVDVVDSFGSVSMSPLYGTPLEVLGVTVRYDGDDTASFVTPLDATTGSVQASADFDVCVKPATLLTAGVGRAFERAFTTLARRAMGDVPKNGTTLAAFEDKAFLRLESGIERFAEQLLTAVRRQLRFLPIRVRSRVGNAISDQLDVLALSLRGQTEGSVKSGMHDSMIAFLDTYGDGARILVPRTSVREARLVWTAMIGELYAAELSFIASLFEFESCQTIWQPILTIYIPQTGRSFVDRRQVDGSIFRVRGGIETDTRS